MAVCVKSEPERGSTLTSDAHSLQDRCIDRTEGVICVDSQHSGTARGLNDSQCSAGNDMAACKIKSEPSENKVFFSGFTATMTETGQFKCEHKKECERSVTACHKELPGSSNQSESDVHKANESLCTTECRNISNDTFSMDQFKLNDTGPDSRKSSGSLSALTEQRGINMGVKVHRCCECGKSFMNTAALTKHRKTHVTDKTYVCAQCGKGFTNHSYLKKHHRVHSGEKPFTCSDCGQKFTVANSLKVHMRFHSGEKPYHCSECDVGFFTLSTFKNHVLNHSGEKPNVCHQCGKSFKDATSLRRHCHSEKPYSCSECGKSFTQAANLKIHMRIHSGEKPYSCTLCGKCFAQKSGFTIHIRTHSGEKPSICDYCGKGFKHISYLKRHLKIHSGEKSKEVTTLIGNNECDRDSAHKDTAFALNTDKNGASECVDQKQMKIFECRSGCIPAGQQTDPQSIAGDKTAVCKVKCEWDSCETGPALTTVSGVELQDHLRTDQIKTENADRRYDALPRQTKPHCVSTEEPTQLKCEWD